MAQHCREAAGSSTTIGRPGITHDVIRAASRGLDSLRGFERFAERARGIPPRYESSGAVSHSFEQRDPRFVRAAFEFHVRPLRSAAIFGFRLARSRYILFGASGERSGERERERLEFRVTPVSVSTRVREGERAT